MFNICVKTLITCFLMSFSAWAMEGSPRRPQLSIEIPKRHSISRRPVEWDGSPEQSICCCCGTVTWLVSSLYAIGRMTPSEQYPAVRGVFGPNEWSPEREFMAVFPVAGIAALNWPINSIDSRSYVVDRVTKAACWMWAAVSHPFCRVSKEKPL